MGEPDGDLWPPKPKGMRWRTSNAGCNKLDVEAYALNIDVLRGVE